MTHEDRQKPTNRDEFFSLARARRTPEQKKKLDDLQATTERVKAFPAKLAAHHADAEQHRATKKAGLAKATASHGKAQEILADLKAKHRKK